MPFVVRLIEVIVDDVEEDEDEEDDEGDGEREADFVCCLFELVVM